MNNQNSDSIAYRGSWSWFYWAQINPFLLLPVLGALSVDYLDFPMELSRWIVEFLSLEVWADGRPPLVSNGSIRYVFEALMLACLPLNILAIWCIGVATGGMRYNASYVLSKARARGERIALTIIKFLFSACFFGLVACIPFLTAHQPRSCGTCETDSMVMYFLVHAVGVQLPVTLSILSLNVAVRAIMKTIYSGE
jgi:hypothetical protein